MAVGGVRGGGRGSGPKGPTGPRSTGSSFKVTGNESAGKAESLVGASRASETAAAGPVDPVTSGAAQIAKGLRDGTITDKSEATKKLVALILEDRKLLGKDGKASKRLVKQISDTLQDDPRLMAALERTWSRAGEK